MLSQQTQHVKSMLKLRWRVNIEEFPRHIDLFFNVISLGE